MPEMYVCSICGKRMGDRDELTPIRDWTGVYRGGACAECVALSDEDWQEALKHLWKPKA